jgi:Domain of unknown function (DUF4126)
MRDIRSMDVLETLCAALGLATLAGINLYLTVFVTGMAVQFGWVVLPTHLHDLSVLGEPWVIAIAGTLYFLEFFADKVPWVDSANDAVHTLIRPIGGALLGVLALGEADPAAKVIAALLAGGATLTVHAAKAGVRLIANVSPEPFSNVGLSLGEDLLVLGGLGLLLWNPLVALTLAIVALGIIWTMFPGILRRIRCAGWLAWRKLSGPSVDQEPTELQKKLPPDCVQALGAESREAIAFAAWCISEAGPEMPRASFGWLTQVEDGRLFFVAPRARGARVVEVPLAGAWIGRDSRFLSEKLCIRSARGGVFEFAFERGDRFLVAKIARELAPRARRELEAAVAI